MQRRGGRAGVRWWALCGGAALSLALAAGAGRAQARAQADDEDEALDEQSAVDELNERSADAAKTGAGLRCAPVTPQAGYTYQQGPRQPVAGTQQAPVCVPRTALMQPPSTGVMVGQQDVVMQTTQRALVNLKNANRAIDGDDFDQAARLLEDAGKELERLFTSVPAGPVLSRLEQAQRDLQGGRGVDMAPIIADLRQRAVFLDPSVAVHAEEAQRQIQQGQREAAVRHIVMARQALIGDIAFEPVEDAFARTVAARAELRAGRVQTARRLLQDVPILLDTVQSTAPLVPVRFDLRAAAMAVEQGNQQAAQQLIAQARSRLGALHAVAPGNTQVQSLTRQIDELTHRMASGQVVPSRDIRALAQKTRSTG